MRSGYIVFFCLPGEDRAEYIILVEGADGRLAPPLLFMPHLFVVHRLIHGVFISRASVYLCACHPFVGLVGCLGKVEVHVVRVLSAEVECVRSAAVVFVHRLMKRLLIGKVDMKSEELPLHPL